MKIHNILTVFAIICGLSWSIDAQSQYEPLTNQKRFLTKADSITAAQFPKLYMPEAYLQRGSADLPASINNAELPFFRPTFSQLAYWNCGQSAGIGYNFTYELNQARNLRGDLPENQMSVNFSWNFMNTGFGWGVSFFHSFDILKACGNPNLADYGGLFDGGETKWMSGYDLYEHAMQNRISGVYSIDIGTPEGLLTLKHWLNDHLDASPHGGVANFYLTFGITKPVPPESPETGAPLIIECAFDIPAGHALTIIGYNDSVRYDLNADGRFTNNKDINNDGVVDMQDWEIGALRYKNSTLNNDGYGLMMYRTLALKYGEGGIWNQQAHVLKVKENYTPLATMRVKIRHTSRNKLKLIAGVSSDTASGIPAHTIDFPIFNYQGGDQYMQGGNTDASHQFMELSLDISPLLSHIQPNEYARFFLQIAEKDEEGTGSGALLYLSLVDFQHGGSEAVSTEFPRTIANNTITTLSVISKMDFSQLEITTGELPAVVPGVQSNVQMTAKNGQLPYTWEVMQPYSMQTIAYQEPQFHGTQLTIPDDDVAGLMVGLPFSFPFYNNFFDSISVYKHGFIMFEDKPFPYPYFIGEETMLKGRKTIAPFMAEMEINPAKGDGVWVQNTPDYVELSWKTSFASYDDFGVAFALRLYPDGHIGTYYSQIQAPPSELWCSGISKGDHVNYSLNAFSQQIGVQAAEAFEYVPPKAFPADIEIDQSGLLSLRLEDGTQIEDVVIQVTDDHGVYDRKKFQLSSGLIFNYEVQGGTGHNIHFFDTAAVRVEVKNISGQTHENITMNFSSADPHLGIVKDVAYIGTLAPQQSVLISDALRMYTEPDIHDLQALNVSTTLSTSVANWHAELDFLALAPDCMLTDIRVLDDQNGILEPGETAELELNISNMGHAGLSDFEIEMQPDELVMDIENPTLSFDHLIPGEVQRLVYRVKARQHVHLGREISIHFNITKGGQLVSRIEKSLLIDKIPVLILDLDPQQLSGPVFAELLDSLQLNYTYRKNYPTDYEEYMSVFVCLGNMFDNVELMPAQADLLSDFLISGAKVYMEGRVTWHEDIPTSLHTYFNIEAAGDGNYYAYDTVYGRGDCFTEDMVFGYNSTFPYNNSYIQPVLEAFPILSLSTADSACVIANDGGTYKTIGSALEFGGLVDTDTTSTRLKYLLGMIDFFGLRDYMLSVQPLPMDPFQNPELSVFPNPFSEQLSIELPAGVAKDGAVYIFDLSGRLVNRLSLIGAASGVSATTNWDGKDFSGNPLPKGLYIIKVLTKEHSLVKKVLHH